MRYDQDGFPISPEFELPPEPPERESDPLVAVPIRRGASPRKRIFLIAVILGVVVPLLVAPVAKPMIWDAVVLWSLQQAAISEVENDLPSAVGHLSRAIDWHGRNAELLCMRAMLRLESQDVQGAIADAELASHESPTSPLPVRTRAIAHVVAGQPREALDAAELAVRLSGPGSPEALNHRAYIRALVGKELPKALEDIENALLVQDDHPVEFLDTRGFILHLLGRQQEAVDQLNLAIDGMKTQRRQASLLARQVDEIELARRLRWFDHSLAVMHHHRGLACREIGLDAQAQQDFRIAKQKGFDPERGIF